MCQAVGRGPKAEWVELWVQEGRITSCQHDLEQVLHQPQLQHGCICVLWQQTITHLVAKNNTDLRGSSGDQKFKIKLSAELHSFWNR